MAGLETKPTLWKACVTWSLGSVLPYPDSPRENTQVEHLDTPLPILVKVTAIAGSVKSRGYVKGMPIPRNTVHIKCETRFLYSLAH